MRKYSTPFSADILTSPSGQLVVVTGDVYRYSPAQIAMTGVVTAQPDQFTIAGGFASSWGAYDPNGNLWLAGGREKFVFVAPSDLAKTVEVTVTPTVTIRPPVTISASFGSIAVR